MENKYEEIITMVTASVSIIGDSALVFSAEDSRSLREKYGIAGILTGTLPIAPQQSLLLGVPLRLSVEEVLYLYEKKAIEFAGAIDTDCSNPTAADSDGGFYETPNSITTTVSPDQETLLYEYVCAQEQDMDEIYRTYCVFKKLKQYGQFILPGLRFGGKFVSYPGDPLKYHSHFIVNTKNYYSDKLDLMELTKGGRLATNVKKIWLLAGEKGISRNHKDGLSFLKQETRTVLFSIEWSGFG
ncbi:hypothetical protein OGAPHI_000582 [Ogataea philodendri]|uniref:tRNA-splicing endonuclease subunit Sen34 n=1 Tax=Ogataea philodendri TaxID=1378263 RepID=A0A9P8PFC2_9ASCO|nr:uncharacterized protein OGAPHI_000582 [Ogataea philodendri]KAH3670871.1 hypothetical protein OGAPHI_000582 [Ogataea philodendri]